MGKNNGKELEVFEGVMIRKSNVIRIRVGASKYKEIISEVKKTGLSIPKIICISSKPCDNCKGIQVIIYNDADEKIEVKRGILSDYSIMNNGTNILKQNE